MCVSPYSKGASLVAGLSDSATDFQARLEALRDELRGRRHDLTIEHAAEAVEQSALYQMRDQAAADTERDARQLGAVLDALQRLKDGTWGICLCGCDEPISKKRLAAIPWAPYRIECQRRIEAEQAERVRREDEA
jgi:RNA polymerase-binding transcription factor DksA